MVDFLDKGHAIDISVLAWYILFGIFFLWTAFTVVPTTATALQSPNYIYIMQGYSESLVAIILIFIAAYAILMHVAKGISPNHRHLWPFLKKIYPSDKHVGSWVLFILLLLAIIVIAVYLRTTMLGFFGFYEPDGFYYYSVLRAAVNNGFNVPSVLSISGWPSHAPFTEAKGLILVPLLQYAILQFAGISYYTIMRLSPVEFGLLDMAAAYILSRYLSKDKLFGLLVIAFVGFSMGNAARTSALIFRGDTFASFFVIVALIFFVEFFRQEGTNRKIIFSVLTGLALALADFVWNGASFGIGTFMFAFAILLLAGFVLRKEQLVNNSKYLLLSLAVWFIAVMIAVQLSFIVSLQLVSIVEFVPIFIVMVIFWAIVNYLTYNIQNVTILQSSTIRLALILGTIVVGFIIFALVEPGIINDIFVANGFISAPGSVGTTIQELQPPTAGFLSTSFGINLFTTPQTLAMYIPLYFGFFSTVPTATSASCNIVWTCSAGLIGVILLFILFIPYFFMQIYDSGGFLSGNARIRPDINIAMVTIAAYFILTTYLQMHAIRFNSLISIPLAILSAYTMYWILAFAKGVMNMRYLVFVGATLIFIILIWLVTQTGATSLLYWMMILAAIIGLLASIVLIIYAVTSKLSDSQYDLSVYGITFLIFIAFFAILLVNDNVYAQTLSQADSINPTFISALNWMHANLPSNSTVLTLWPDGSVVEGVANLTAVTDSVGSQNGTKLIPFAAWILSSSPDPGFLESSLSGRPGYLLVRFPWLIETQGIYTEAEFNVTQDPSLNASLFGYLPLTQFEEGAPNSTSTQLIFRSEPTGYPYAVVNLNRVSNSSEQSTIYGYIQISQTQISPFSQVGFYDSDTGNFTLAPQTQYNQSNGESLVVTYSAVPKSGFYLNITGAYIFGPAIAQSNMIKFLYFCSSTSCIWDNNESTMQLIYQNPDTKVFKITYNN